MAKKRETARERSDREARESLASMKQWCAALEASLRGLKTAITEHERRLSERAMKEGSNDGDESSK